MARQQHFERDTQTSLPSEIVSLVVQIVVVQITITKNRHDRVLLLPRPLSGAIYQRAVSCGISRAQITLKHTNTHSHCVFSSDWSVIAKHWEALVKVFCSCSCSFNTTRKEREGDSAAISWQRIKTNVRLSEVRWWWGKSQGTAKHTLALCLSIRASMIYWQCQCHRWCCWKTAAAAASSSVHHQHQP